MVVLCNVLWYLHSAASVSTQRCSSCRRCMALKYGFNFHGELLKVVRCDEQMNGVGVFQMERVQWLSLIDCVGVVCVI